MQANQQISELEIKGGTASFKTSHFEDVLAGLPRGEGISTAGIDVMAGTAGPGSQLVGCCVCFDDEVALPEKVRAYLVGLS